MESFNIAKDLGVPLIISGGNKSPDLPAESLLVSKLFQNQNIILETKSKNTYQSAMGKQALGVHCTNYNERYDTFSHVLSYPQRPIIETKMMKYLNGDKLPNGINIVHY